MADGGQRQLRGDLGPAVGAGSPRMGSSVRAGQRGVLQPNDPTDPEVPAAKRLRAARRKRTMLLAGTSVAVLLAALFALLYRMAQQVTTARTPSAEGFRETAEPGPASETVAPEVPRGALPNTAPSVEALPEPVDVNGERPSGAGSAMARAAASSRPAPAATDMPASSPKAPANRDIFRRPTF
jgi:hypothetical protein